MVQCSPWQQFLRKSVTHKIDAKSYMLPRSFHIFRIYFTVSLEGPEKCQFVNEASYFSKNSEKIGLYHLLLHKVSKLSHV